MGDATAAWSPGPPRNVPTDRVAAPPTGSPIVSDRPSRRGYWLGLALLFAAFVVGGAMIVSAVVGLNNNISDLTRIEGEDRVVDLNAGAHTVYDESPSDAGFVALSIVDESGNAVPTEPYIGSFTYTAGGRSGAAIGTVSIPEDGTYRVSTGSAATAVAIGPSVTDGSFTGMLVGGIGLAALLALAGVLAIVITAIRSRS